MLNPPFLKSGSTIGIVSTARKITATEIQPAIEIMGDWGFNVLLSNNIDKENHQFAGTDEERINAFQQMLNNPAIDAIICARGGYGTVRIVDHLDWTHFKKHPKWICGYSDVTVLHSFIHARLDIATMHSTMPINFKSNGALALSSFKNALFGKPNEIMVPPHPLNKLGSAEGPITGGNLSILYSLLGSKDQVDTRGKILFLEDLDEYLYHIDRVMMALKRAGMLDELAGLVVGGMTDMNDNTIPYGKAAVEIISEHVKDFGYPVAFNFPIGHLDDNRTLIMGGLYEIEVSENESLLSKK